MMQPPIQPLPDPLAPDSSVEAITLAMVRGIMQILAGFGFTWALTVSGSQETMIASGLVMVGTLVWSSWQKLKAARVAAKAKRAAEVDAAMASAQATLAASRLTPVTVTVTQTTPAGQPNVGVAQRIGNTEAALATTVTGLTAPAP